MWTLIVQFWTDPAKFIGMIRGLGVILAAMFASGAIPTHVDGAGWKVAVGIAAVIAAIPAGQKNDTPAPPPK